MAKSNKKAEQSTNYQVVINTNEEKKKISDVPALAKKADLVINTQEDLNAAGEVLTNVKTRAKELDAERKKITNPLDEAKKAVMALFKPPIELLTRAENHVKGLILEYDQKKEREAEEERQRLEKIAEQERKKKEKAIEAKIERAKASGKEDKVAELEEEKENVETTIDVPVVASNIDTPTDVSYRENWTAEVVDFKTLPDEYKLPNEKMLNSFAKSTKGAIPVPGVKFNMQKVVVART